MQNAQLDTMLQKHETGNNLSPRRYNMLEIYQGIQSWKSQLNPKQEEELCQIEDEINEAHSIDPNKFNKRKMLLRMKYNAQLMTADQ